MNLGLALVWYSNSVGVLRLVFVSGIVDARDSETQRQRKQPEIAKGQNEFVNLPQQCNTTPKLHEAPKHNASNGHSTMF